MPAIPSPVIIEGLKYPTDSIKYFNRISQKAALMQKIESTYQNEMSRLLSLLFSLLASIILNPAELSRNPLKTLES